MTGKQSFLSPYISGKKQTDESVRKLETLFGDDPDALAGVDRIRSRIDEWQQLAADFEIDAKRAGREETVSALVASGTGRQLFERVRSEIADVMSSLDSRLRRQQHRVSELTHRLDALRIANIVVAMAIIGITGKLAIDWLTMPLQRLSQAVRNTAAGALRDPIPATGPPDVAELAADVDAMRRRLLAGGGDAARARAALADRGMIVVTLRD